jgi:hypothetical protein
MQVTKGKAPKKEVLKKISEKLSNAKKEKKN